ncbi:unnamed protein product [Laminaria digitata]
MGLRTSLLLLLLSSARRATVAASSMDLASGSASDRARLALVLRHVRKKRARLVELGIPDDDSSEDEDASCVRRRRRQACAMAARQGPVMMGDARDGAEFEEEERAKILLRQQVKKVERLLPGIGRGNSVANSEASRKRRTLVYPDGIYGHFCEMAWVGEADGFRQMTGFNQAEFDEFYAQTHWRDVPIDGVETPLLPRPWFFLQARNNLGEHSATDNKQRRTIKGLLDDRDRVLCWLQMLRRDQQFGDMSLMYGPSKGTFHNDFKDMCAAAQNMPCLSLEIVWTGAVERKTHGEFLTEWGHPEFVRVAYIVDGTKVTMRNPSRVGKGQKEPHDAVHAAHHSRNKGLGYSHIVYCNFRGKIIRVETVQGASSDRGAHLASHIYLDPNSFLSEGETGMGDGNYRGNARAGDSSLMMCVPYTKSANAVLSPAEKNFNSQQRRFRVVVENTIGQIKKWKTIGGQAFRHERDFENEVFDVCARLTARIMRVRNQYPRSLEWTTGVMEGWESKLGIHLWMDYEDPGSYLIHNRGEDYVYGTAEAGTATDLQNRWEAIWGMTGV